MADLWAQQYVAVEAIYASRFSTKFSVRLYTVKQNALGRAGGQYNSNRQIASVSL